MTISETQRSYRAFRFQANLRSQDRQDVYYVFECDCLRLLVSQRLRLSLSFDLSRHSPFGGSECILIVLDPRLSAYLFAYSLSARLVVWTALPRGSHGPRTTANGQEDKNEDLLSYETVISTVSNRPAAIHGR